MPTRSAWRIFAAIFLAAVVGIPVMTMAGEPASRPAYPLHETPAQRDARLKWWRDARFGMFIHWGPVSLEGAEISWSRANTNPACPNKGPIPADVYDNLYKRFNPTKFDANAWVRLARDAGMKYMVLIAKHCDGFCMWNSPSDPYNIMHTPFKRDVCGEFARAAHAAGMRFGWYYSPMDWRDPDFRTARNERYLARMRQQVRELLMNYGKIDVLWWDWDGGAPVYDQATTWKLVRTLQPKMVINDRLDLGPGGPPTSGDFHTPEQHIGDFDMSFPWETCMTLGTQWAWKPNDTIKSLDECIQTRARCAGGDGNLLLNVGPMPTGEIEPRQAQRLREIGTWLRTHGQSIYGTRGGPFKPNKTLASTHAGKHIYVHVFRWAGNSITLPGIDAKIMGARVLGGGPVEISQAGPSIKVTVPPDEREPADTVIDLELDRAADQIAPVDVALGQTAAASTKSAQSLK